MIRHCKAANTPEGKISCVLMEMQRTGKDGKALKKKGRKRGVGGGGGGTQWLKGTVSGALH